MGLGFDLRQLNNRREDSRALVVHLLAPLACTGTVLLSA
jgi:hypothetical protein